MWDIQQPTLALGPLPRGHIGESRLRNRRSWMEASSLGTRSCLAAMTKLNPIPSVLSQPLTSQSILSVPSEPLPGFSLPPSPDPISLRSCLKICFSQGLSLVLPCLLCSRRTGQFSHRTQPYLSEFWCRTFFHLTRLELHVV